MQLETKPLMTSAELYKAAERMSYYGGSFERGLAHLFFCADSVNIELIVTTWGHLFEKYNSPNWV